MNDHADPVALRPLLSEAAIPHDEFLRAREANLARWPTRCAARIPSAAA